LRQRSSGFHNALDFGGVVNARRAAMQAKEKCRGDPGVIAAFLFFEIHPANQLHPLVDPQLMQR
jgi:hypothetical protein